MNKLHFLKGITRILTDFLSGFLAWGMAYYIRPWTDLIPHIHFVFPVENLPHPDFFLSFSLCSSFGLIVLFSSQSLYSYPARYLTSQIVGKIFWGTILWTLSVIAVYSLVFHEQIFSRIMLAHAGIFTVFFALLFRFGERMLFEIWFRGKKSVLILGSKNEIKGVKNVFQNSEYTDIYTLSPKIPQEYRSVKSDEIFVFENSFSHDFLLEIHHYAAAQGIILHTIPRDDTFFLGHTQIDVIRGFPVITTAPYKENIWWKVGKRGFDILFSLFFLLVFSPLFLLLSVLIKKDSRSWNAPVFYISQRVGRNGKLFWIWKFRSMSLDADKHKKELEKLSHREGPLFKIKDDPRITKIGRFLRKTSLDEIPQFINVLQGNMSVIGPRPHLQNEVAKYSSVQKRVLSAKPGISGLAQVSGRSDLSFEDEIALDSYYIKNSSFLLDMKIFIKTPLVLVFGKGAD